MYLRHSPSSRADTQVYFSQRLDRYNSPCIFILPCSIQDRAIKEHSGCQLDEFFLPASLWQVRICSLAEKIGLNRIPIFPRMSVLVTVLCCPHSSLKTQSCREVLLSSIIITTLRTCRATPDISNIIDGSIYSCLAIMCLIRLPCIKNRCVSR